MLRNGGGVPALPVAFGSGGNYDAAGAASVRSGGSARSRVPLSARSAASAISMHINSYSYLSNRVYEYLHARSAWLRRTQHEHNEGGDEWEDAALKRLPQDFEPFFAVDRRTRRLDDDSTSSVSTTQDRTARRIGARVKGLAFRLLFTVFSSRHWDRLYLLLGLSWSILCPGYMDGAIAVERGQLASLLLVMFVAAGAPALLAFILKVFFSIRLRSRLLHDDRGRFVGVFFILATKVVSVPALCGGGRLCERRVHTLTTDDLDCDDNLDCGDNTNALEGATARKMNSGREEEEHKGGDQSPQQGVRGSGAGSSRPTTPLERKEESWCGGERERGRSANRKIEGSKNRTELDLPPRHWMCTVCKKVNMLPENWTGRAGKVIQVVIKRKEVDKQAMYGAFKTRPGVPLCGKCHTPFNYSWRSGGDSDQTPQQQRQRQLLEAALSRPATAASSAPSAAPGTDADVGKDEDQGTGGLSFAGFLGVLTKAVGFMHALVSRSRRRRDKNKLIDAGGGAEAGDAAVEPELWYGREFRRQLTTYFKPELERPSLSSPLAQGGGRMGGGGRYPVGARVACFAGKEAWYPGAVVASRENNTYDVRFDNGDIAQHVFPHMIRFEPIHTDSHLLCFYYGLALATAVAWPLAGFGYFYSSTTADATAIVALPALVAGVAGALAVAVQFCEIYAENKSAGLGVTAKFAAIFSLPALSLAVVGGLAVLKALNPASSGSWMEMLLLPSVFFSLTGGGYAHAVAPAYGKAWAAASLPWLIFLLLVTLRLDGERGDARPGFGRMRWLGVYSPLWVFLLMLIAAHQALPYVWDIGVFRPPPAAAEGEEAGDGKEKAKGRARVWFSRGLGVLTGALAARRERRGEQVAAAAATAAAAAAAAIAVVENDDDNGEDLEAGGVDGAPPSAASNSGGGDDENDTVDPNRRGGEKKEVPRGDSAEQPASPPSSPPVGD